MPVTLRDLRFTSLRELKVKTGSLLGGGKTRVTKLGLVLGLHLIG